MDAAPSDGVESELRDRETRLQGRLQDVSETMALLEEYTRRVKRAKDPTFKGSANHLMEGAEIVLKNAQLLELLVKAQTTLLTKDDSTTFTTGYGPVDRGANDVAKSYGLNLELVAENACRNRYTYRATILGSSGI